MSEYQLFAVEPDYIRPLPIPDSVKSFADLFDGLPLGVYSALCTFEHNKFLYLEEHIKRTVQSLQLMHWDYQLDELLLRQALHEVCTAYPLPNSRVRFDVLAESPVHLGTNSRLLIGLIPFPGVPDSFYEDGVAVDFAPTLHRENPLAKTADFAQVRRHLVPTETTYEYLLLDEQGHILEGTGTNFYGVRDDMLYTAGEGVLEGITRKIILEQAQLLGISVCLEPIHQDEITTLTEAGISSSSRALLPVVSIAGQIVGNGRPGPICRRMLTAYNSFVSQQIRIAIDN